MNHTDIDSKIDWAAFYEQRLGRAIVSRSGDEWTVRCPLHKGGEEKHPSLSVNVKNSLWHCHGCNKSGNGNSFLVESEGMTVEAAREAIKRLAGDDVKAPPKAAPKKTKLTLAEYAADKHLPTEFLESIGVKNLTGCLGIPYIGEGGEAGAMRRRFKGALRFKWMQGDTTSLYGLWFLPDLRETTDTIILVEGESDAQTLWYRGYANVLGVPGADMMRVAWVPAVAFAKNILIHVEPGESGEKFRKKCVDSFARANYQGQVYEFSTRGAKDPSDLHIAQVGADSDQFRQLWESSISAALPIDLTTQATEAQGNLPGCPVTGLKWPDDYTVTMQGIRAIVVKKDQQFEERISPVPLVISRRLKSIDTGEEKIELAYHRDGEWAKVVTKRSTAFSSRGIVELSDGGMPITSESASKVVKYLGALEGENLDSLPRARSVERMGWVGREKFMPYMADDIVLDPAPGTENVAEAYHQRGTLEEWVKAARLVRDNYPRARFMLATSFAAPLLRDLRQRVFFLHFYGPSGGGKTASMKFALSAWGAPDDLMVTFNATKVGLERLAGFFNDLPLGIDERQVEATGKGGQSLIESIVYMLGSGRGRVRGAKGGGLQATQSWRTIALSTGEQSLSSSNSQAGVKTRSLEIFGTPIGDDEVAAGIHRTIEDNYGTAGHAFLKTLITYIQKGGDPKKDFEGVCERIAEIAPKHIRAHVSAIACITLADAYASGWVFGETDPGAALESSIDMAREILASIETAEEADYCKRAIEWIEGWLMQHANRFYDDDTKERWGFAEHGVVWIIPAQLRRDMAEDGFNYERVLRDLAGEGRIVNKTDSNGTIRFRQRKQFQKSRTRMIGFRPDFEGVNGPDEPFSEGRGPGKSEAERWWDR